MTAICKSHSKQGRIQWEGFFFQGKGRGEAEANDTGYVFFHDFVKRNDSMANNSEEPQVLFMLKFSRY